MPIKSWSLFFSPLLSKTSSIGVIWFRPQELYLSKSSRGKKALILSCCCEMHLLAWVIECRGLLSGTNSFVVWRSTRASLERSLLCGTLGCRAGDFYKGRYTGQMKWDVTNSLNLSLSGKSIALVIYFVKPLHWRDQNHYFLQIYGAESAGLIITFPKTFLYMIYF